MASIMLQNKNKNKNKNSQQFKNLLTNTAIANSHAIKNNIANVQQNIQNGLKPYNTIYDKVNVAAPTTSKPAATPAPAPTVNNTPVQTVTNSSYTSGGVSAPAVEDYAIDLSDILAAYTKSAEAQKQTIKDTTESQRQILANNLASQLESLRNSEKTQRETLTRALDRFREDTNKSRQQQQSAFNSSRADLEAQAYLANRQALQSAAARGLGGSGLQQLAQLQNLINQGAETSNLAKSNTDAINTLAQALARQEQDTTSNLTNLANTTDQQARALQTQNTDALNALLSNSANQLNEIDANSASLQKQLQYQEAVRAQDARVQAERFAAQMAAQNASAANQMYMFNKQLELDQQALDASNAQYNNKVASNLSGIIESAQKAMEEASKKTSPKTRQKAVEEAVNNANDAIRAYASAEGLSDSTLSTYKNQLSSLMNSYNKKYSNATISDIFNPFSSYNWFN